MTARKVIALLIGVVSVAMLSTTGVLADSQATSTTDMPRSVQPPPWPEDFPKPGEMVPVVGPNGQLIRCPDGDLLKVEMGGPTPSELDKARPAPSNAGFPGEEVVDPIVPRCGPGGGGADGRAIWMPASQGRDRVQAPPDYVDAQSP